MSMQISPLNAISPIDGRYRRLAEPLHAFFSESALIRYRVLVEVEYFIALCEIPLPQLSAIDPAHFESIRGIYRNFVERDAGRVKEIEKVTNHDVKAVEYFLKEKFDAIGIGEFKEFVHFGLTSQDINNTALPYLRKAVAMLARTHGQPASPTTVGKELYVFVDRLRQQVDSVASIPFSSKFGGATGNFNAHHVAYPDIDWIGFANRFVNERLGLQRSQVTTQIEPYDHLAALCDAFKRINTILIDFSRDVWAYISMDYFKQKIKDGEVGSSVMPHKVNPIDFENAEGNLGVANAVFEHLAAKLPVSRLQRDLTDSTVTRNVGVPLAHTLIAVQSLLKGLDKLVLNHTVIREDLNSNWAVVAEGIQTILRREGYPEPFETLKELTRKHSVIDRKTIEEFIRSLKVSKAVKAELMKITPENYTGLVDF
jgi:adenylosuccinate lyase